MSPFSGASLASLLVCVVAKPSHQPPPLASCSSESCDTLGALDDQHDGMSLLQRQVMRTARPTALQPRLLGADTEDLEGGEDEEQEEDLALNEVDFHGHFHLCRHVPVGWHANCEHVGGDTRSEEVDSPQKCTRLALRLGADTFNFRRSTQTCWALKCGGEDLHVSRRLEHNSWEVHSTWCGVISASLTTTFAPSSRLELEDEGECGHHKSDFVLYPQPSRKSCENRLNLSNLANNNLGGLGPTDGPANMRFVEALPGTDLLVATASPYPYTPKLVGRNGLDGTFGRVNVQSNSTVDLVFKFVESGTQKLRRVDSLLFSFFNIDQAKECTARMELQVADFSAYYVSKNTQLHVAHDESNRLLLRSMVKGSGMQGPRGPMKLDSTEKRRAVTFLFDEVEEFWATLSVKQALDTTTARNFLFAGASSLVGKACSD